MEEPDSVSLEVPRSIAGIAQRRGNMDIRNFFNITGPAAARDDPRASTLDNFFDGFDFCGYLFLRIDSSDGM